MKEITYLMCVAFGIISESLHSKIVNKTIGSEVLHVIGDGCFIWFVDKADCDWESVSVEFAYSKFLSCFFDLLDFHSVPFGVEESICEDFCWSTVHSDADVLGGDSSLVLDACCAEISGRQSKEFSNIRQCRIVIDSRFEKDCVVSFLFGFASFRFVFRKEYANGFLRVVANCFGVHVAECFSHEPMEFTAFFFIVGAVHEKTEFVSRWLKSCF